MQVPNGTGPGVRRSKRPLLASRTRCNVLWKPPKFGNKVKIGNKVQFGNKFANWCNVWSIDAIKTDVFEHSVSKCDNNLILYQILYASLQQNLYIVCMEHSAYHKNALKRTKKSIFWPSSKCIGDGSWRFCRILAYHTVSRRQQSVKKIFPTLMWYEWRVPRVDLVCFGFVRFRVVSSQPFARNDWLFGKQLFYEYQNDEQHHLCSYQLLLC